MSCIAMLGEEFVLSSFMSGFYFNDTFNRQMIQVISHSQVAK